MRILVADLERLFLLGSFVERSREKRRGGRADLTFVGILIHSILFFLYLVLLSIRPSRGKSFPLIPLFIAIPQAGSALMCVDI